MTLKCIIILLKLRIQTQTTAVNTAYNYKLCRIALSKFNKLKLKQYSSNNNSMDTSRQTVSRNYRNSNNAWNTYINYKNLNKTQKLKKFQSSKWMPKKKKKVKRSKVLILKYIISKANTIKLHQLIDTKTQHSLININTARIPQRKEFREMLKNCLSFFPFIQLNRIAARLIGALFELLYLKNTQGLARFIQRTFEAIHYKKHNTYFSYINQLVREILLPQISKFNCLGVCIIFRGKLGIGGNARKRSLKYRTGMSSASSKFLKINRTFAIIRTKTGVVGFSVLVAW